jgi:hypothetical protein
MTTLIPKINFKNGGSTPTGAASRTINEKAQDYISVKDFGAVGDGSTDDTTAIRNAINFGITNGNAVYFPAGNYNVTNQIPINGSVKIFGTTFSDTNAFENHYGSRIYINFLTSTATSCFYVTYNGVQIEGLQFYSNQPAPTSGWTPTTTPWSIYAYRLSYANTGGDGLKIVNCSVYGVSHGIKADGATLNINGLTGSCFNTMIDLDGCYDVCQINNVRANSVWWNTDSNVTSYINSNLIFMKLGRVDNPQINNIFVYGANVGIQCDLSTAVSPSGSLALGCFSNFGFDYITKAAVYITGANTRLLMQNGYFACNITVASNGILIDSSASSVNIDLSNVEFNNSGAEAILCNSTSTSFRVSNSYVKSWASTTTTATGFDIDFNSVMLYSNVLWGTGGTGTRLGSNGTFICGGPIDEPNRAAAVDVSQQSFTVNASANYPLLSGSGQIIITSETTGETGMYLVGGTAVVLVSQTATQFVASSSPAAGKIGVAWNGTTYVIYVGSGSNQNLYAAFTRTRPNA